MDVTKPNAVKFGAAPPAAGHDIPSPAGPQPRRGLSPVAARSVR